MTINNKEQVKKEFNLSEKMLKIKQQIKSNNEDNTNCKITYKEFHDRDIIYRAKFEVFEDIKEFIKWVETEIILKSTKARQNLIKLKKRVGDDLI